MEIPAKIHYLLYRRNWREKEFGANLPDGGVGQWQVSRWLLGKEKPSERRRKQIDDRLYETIAASFGGFRYICNLGDKYGHKYEDRADDALARLRSALLEAPPAEPVGCLNIFVRKTVLPSGVRAQCFSSGEDEPTTFFILVNDVADWRANVRDEVFAHVLPFKTESSLTIKDE
jgi:hypothetical protein